MTKNALYIILAAILVAWFFRWDVVAVPRGDAIGVAYMINKWTGSVYMLHGSNIIEVRPTK